MTPLEETVKHEHILSMFHVSRNSTIVGGSWPHFVHDVSESSTHVFLTHAKNGPLRHGQPATIRLARPLGVSKPVDAVASWHSHGALETHLRARSETRRLCGLQSRVIEPTVLKRTAILKKSYV
jgi:hypothetical protein